jgi:hypothetical protein
MKTVTQPATTHTMTETSTALAWHHELDHQQRNNHGSRGAGGDVDR